MRKKDDSLRNLLLDCARAIVDREGTDGVTIRAIAKQAGIAVGTVYNYFENKEEILLALTREYWMVTIRTMDGQIEDGPFSAQLAQMYEYLRGAIAESAGRLMHSLGSLEAAGQQQMTAMQQGMAADLVRRMEADAGIRADIWSDVFTKEQFARFILSNMTAMLRAESMAHGEGSAEIDFFLELVKRLLY